MSNSRSRTLNLRVSRAIQSYLDEKYKNISSSQKPSEDTMSIAEYKEALENLNIDYLEIELEKENGRKVHFVIPQCQAKRFSNKAWNTIFRGTV